MITKLKTRCALMISKSFINKHPTAKILVVVPTDYLKGQWNEQIISLGIFNNVTVLVINTVVKNEYDVDLLILDEIHGYCSELFYQVFNKVTYKYVLGLTGTLTRLDGKEVLIKEKCPVVDSITMKEAISKGWLSEYTEYRVLIDVDLTDYNLANQDFIKYFSIFNFDFNLAMACLSGEKNGSKITKKAFSVRYDYAKKLCTLKPSDRDYYNTIKSLNAEITASVFAWNNALKKRKEFIMNHPKKLELTRSILEARRDRKAITFSATIKNAEAIGVGYVLHSGQTKKKRGLTKEEFDELDVGVLNTSKSMDCGADVKGLNLGIILCNTSSQIQKKQRLGRIIRFAPEKKAELFTLVLNGTAEVQWYQKSSTGLNYKTISEKQLKDVLAYKEINTRDHDETNFDFRF